MGHTYDLVESTLTRVLKDDSISVVALSGKWGTGKSHLWKTVSQNLDNNKSKPIYISLFGVKTINELKLRIVQNAGLNSDSKYKEYCQNVTNTIKGIAGKLFGVELENLILLSIPTLAKERLIVLDDVERKHALLDIDEIMGFINEYSENYNSRFLLLLNRDKLTDQAIWETLHEKVIDLEIILDPTPADAFAIAVRKNPPPHIESVRTAIETLGINNIRVIRRVCQVITIFLGNYSDLEASAIVQVVPSTVLLTALHYHALPDGPSLSYVASYNSMEHMFAKEMASDYERKQEEIKWDALLQRLGIQSADEYEQIVINYLKSGIIDTKKLDRLIQGYVISNDERESQVRTRKFLNDYFWNPSVDNESLIQAVSEFLDEKIKFISATTITRIFNVVEELGNGLLARQLIDKWIKSFEEQTDLANLQEDFLISQDSLGDPLNQEIHPDILDKFKFLREKKYPPLSLIDSVNRIIKNNSWGTLEKTALSQSTVIDYKSVMRSLKNDDLRKFLYQHFSWPSIGGLMEEPSFATAISNFEAACRDICLSDPQSRLAGIIKREFNRYGLIKKLENNQEQTIVP